MIFDTQLLFYHTTSTYAFTAGEYVSLVGMTESGSGSTAINLQNPRDLGIGDYSPPKVALIIGTGVTTANTTATIHFEFQGSTDSSNWTTYSQTREMTTASLTAGSMPMMIDIPPAPTGIAIPQYYRVFIDVSQAAGTHQISAGTIIGGIVLQRDNAYPPVYPSGFTVV